MKERPNEGEDNLAEQHAAWVGGKGGTFTSRITRRLSERSSRRSTLARVGRWAVAITGAAVVPALPLSRSSAQEGEGEGEPELDFTGTDPTDCNYWRYCNIDGNLCATCAGGGVTTCPPGTTPGAEYWVGCCTDPESSTTYLVAYYDCCGHSNCATNTCAEFFGQQSPYDPVAGSQDFYILWCLSDETQSYACTIAPIIGEDCTARPTPRPSRLGS